MRQQSATEWLARAYRAPNARSLRRADHSRGKLIGIAGAGVAPASSRNWRFRSTTPPSPHQRADQRSAVSFHSAREAVFRCFGDNPFTSVKVGGGAVDDPALGLILIGPATDMPPASVQLGGRGAGPLSVARRIARRRIRRRRSAAAPRARAALQHHQRRDRPHPVHEYRRPAHHRKRASRDALHGARRRERRAATRGSAEQHVLFGGAVAHRARRRRSRPARAAAGRSDRRVRPAVRAAQHRGQRSARRHRRRLDSAQHHRPADGDAADRRELRQAARGREPKCAPSAIG